MTIPEICASCKRGLHTWMETPVGALCLDCTTRRWETTHDARLMAAVLLVRASEERRRGYAGHA